MKTAMHEQQRQERDRVIDGFVDVLDLTGDPRDALDAVGRDYESMRRTLKRAGRHDLVEKLSQWKAQDAKRLQFALGRQWQGA